MSFEVLNLPLKGNRRQCKCSCGCKRLEYYSEYSNNREFLDALFYSFYTLYTQKYDATWYMDQYQRFQAFITCHWFLPAGDVEKALYDFTGSIHAGITAVYDAHMCGWWALKELGFPRDLVKKIMNTVIRESINEAGKAFLQCARLQNNLRVTEIGYFAKIKKGSRE